MAYLLGSLVGTFLLSRLLWLAARKPPSTPAKILGVNLTSDPVFATESLFVR